MTEITIMTETIKRIRRQQEKNIRCTMLIYVGKVMVDR